MSEQLQLREKEITTIKNSDVPEREVEQNDSNSSYLELDILEHSDLSFLLNHSIDLFEEEYKDSDEEEPKEETEFAAQAEDEAVAEFSFDLENLDEETTEITSTENTSPVEPLLTEGDDPDFSNLQSEFMGLLEKFESDEEADGPELQVHSEEEVPTSQDEEVPPVEEKVAPESVGSESFHFGPKKSRFRFFRSQNVFQLGVDVGSRYTKYVVCKKSKGGGQLAAFGILPTPFKEDGIDLDAILKELYDTQKIPYHFPNVRCSFNVYGAHVGIKRTTMPKMKAKMAADAVRWMAKKEFGLEEAQSVVVDSIRIGKIEKKGIEHDDLVMVGCEEDIISKMVEPFLERKTVPFKVAPIFITLWELYKKSPAYRNDGVVALVEIGARKTSIVFINNGVLDFAREIPTGGNDITEALTGTIFYDGKPFQFSAEEAEQLKLKYGFPQDDLEDISENGVPVAEYAVLMRPILERLGSEIQRSIDYYREKHDDRQLDQLFLLGGTSRLQNLIPFLGEFIEAEILHLPVPEKLPAMIDPESVSLFKQRFSDFALAYGLATDFDSRLNLLPDSIKRLEKLKLVRRVTTLAFFVVFVSIALLSAFSVINVTTLKSQYQVLQLKYQRLEPLKKRFDELKERQVYLHNKMEIYEKELRLENPLPDVLKVAANLFPQQMAILNMSITETEVFPDEKNKQKEKNAKDKQKQQSAEIGRVLRIIGVYYHPRPDAGIQLADYLRKLQQTNLFTSLGVSSQKYDEIEDRLQFEIVGELN